MNKKSKASKKWTCPQCKWIEPFSDGVNVEYTICPKCGWRKNAQQSQPLEKDEELPLLEEEESEEESQKEEDTSRPTRRDSDWITGKEYLLMMTGLGIMGTLVLWVFTPDLKCEDASWYMFAFLLWMSVNIYFAICLVRGERR